MYSEIAANKRKSWLIVTLFVLFVGLLGFIFGEYTGSKSLTIAVLIGAVTYAAIMYFSGSRLSLSVNGAQEIQKSDNPRLWRTVENLSITDGLPMPRVFIIDDPSPNAFATGRNPEKSAVCVTGGLLDIMDDNELTGVLAHEMGHVKNYDMRVSMIAFALSAVVSVIADIILRLVWFSDDDNKNPVFVVLGIVAAILAPIIALLIQLAISEGLASALEKIEQTGSAMSRQNTATAHFFFASPLKGRSISNLFSTHPPIEERIRRLREMNSHA
jgi:heat shock protein HtpX